MDGGERAELGAKIAYVSRQWRRVVDTRLNAYGLTEATWLPLLHLARAKAPMRQKDLAASLTLDSSSVVRILQGLENERLIERREDADDRRAKTIELTDEGRRRVKEVEAVASAVREELLGPVPDADIAAATRILTTICDRLCRMTEEANAE